jgi:hypothetical protein
LRRGENGESEDNRNQDDAKNDFHANASRW